MWAVSRRRPQTIEIWNSPVYCLQIPVLTGEFRVKYDNITRHQCIQV